VPQEAVQHPGEASRREKDQVDLVARALSGLPEGGQAGSLEEGPSFQEGPSLEEGPSFQEGPSLQEEVSPCPSHWIGRWSGSRASARERSQERDGAAGAEEEEEEDEEEEEQERDEAEEGEDRESEGDELPAQQVNRKLASSALVMYDMCKIIS
jgi:hypothetical protein